MARPRIVMLSPVLSHDAMPHAGGGYVQRLVRELERTADVTVLVPSTPVNRAATSRPGLPTRFLVVGDDDPDRRFAGRAAAAARANADRWLPRVDPGAASRAFAAGLARLGPARDALEAADLVDLQWSETIRLAGVVRRVAPRARLVGTYHDVQSQLFSREPARHRLDPLFWRWAAMLSRRQEHRGVRALDEVVVFAEKDAALLGVEGSARIVRPLLATGLERPRTTVATGSTVLFVAHFARDENDKAVRWLLDTTWPRVTEAVPHARLRLVGAGMADDLTARIADLPGVSAAGFVEDLEPEYAAATCVVVPLRQGAGVKFKTVEALLHDLPVVTTSVGAEGIGGPELFAGLDDDPASLADTLAAVLLDPGAQRARTAAAQAWARERYGPEAFATAVAAAYRP